MPKVKILYILNSLCMGGIENAVISLCNKLDKSRYDVSLLVLSVNDNTLKNHVDSNVHLMILNSKKCRISLLDSCRLMLNFFRIREIIVAFNPDIIHTHMYMFASLPMFLSIKSAPFQIKHCHTIHTSGLYYENLSKVSFKIYVERYFFRKLDTRIICVSKSTKRMLENIYIDNKLIFIPNFVFAEKYKLINNDLDTVTATSFVKIAYIARLVNGKNHIVLFDAFSQLLQIYPNIELHLVGDGYLLENYNAYCNKLGISDHVFFHGNVESPESVTAECNIGVFPSEYEGFSLALTEMCAVGLPMICSNISSIKDMVIDEGDFLFFDTLSASDLCEKFKIILSDTELRNHLRISSLKLAAHYDINNVISKYLEIYET